MLSEFLFGEFIRGSFPMGGPLHAYFVNRSKAKSASLRLRERFPDCNASVDIANDVYLVRVSGVKATWREAAESLLREAGGHPDSTVAKLATQPRTISMSGIGSLNRNY